ncbi:uncharacterized protein K441DRAFT_658354 [Cenococcum geophilum 1.58]|uniref:uncharacterized protein n=1 Tax=Cenococcum geophilum 1.58 TaxID=794803 RepID=UPI00358F932A|nr:hypothetical protein K441DRAFT_658354 [Cenococcum geophilum 1.58]
MGGEVPYLAVELISRILESCTSKATVAVAARCSRQWYDIAMPLLYHRVNINNPQSYELRKSYLKSLAVLFLSKPNIAAHVRHFSLRPGFSDGPEWKSGVELNGDGDWDSALLEKIQEAIASISCSDEERATWLKEADCDDTFLALLLPTLPNLVSLDLMGPIYAKYMERMLWRFGTGAERGSAFTNLKSLFWTYEQAMCTPTGAIINPGIFAMPFIKRIYLHQVHGGYGDEVDERLAQFSPRTSTCTHLELRDCRFHPSDVQNLFLMPKALSTFIYDIGRDQLYYCTVSFSTIRQGLEHHKETLEELCLDYYHGGIELEPGMLDDPSPMTPLNEFLRLKRLKIAPVFILGMSLPPETAHAADQYLRILDFLPKSIKQLQLTHCEEPDNLQILLDALANILIKKVTHVPTLHQIIVEIDFSIVEKLADEFARILKLAEDVGTNIVLLNNFGCSEDKGRSKRVERKWGFDEDIEWKECYEFVNYRPIYEAIDVQH